MATKAKTNGGLVVTAPPEPAWKTLRKLEKAYKDKCEQLERAEHKIQVLEAKLREKEKHK